MHKNTKESIDICRIFNTINDIRKFPKKYSLKLSQYLQYITNITLSLPRKQKILLKEGSNGIKNAMSYLNQTKSLPPFKFNFALSLLAQNSLTQTYMQAQSLTQIDYTEKYKQLGIFDLLFEISFSESNNFSYIENIEDFIILNFILCDNDKTKKNRSILFHNDLNEIGIAFTLDDSRQLIIFEFLFAKNYVSKYKVNYNQNQSQRGLNGSDYSKEEYLKKLIESIEKDIDQKAKNYNQIYSEKKGEKHILFNEANDIITIIKTFMIILPDGSENEISFSISKPTSTHSW